MKRRNFFELGIAPLLMSIKMPGKIEGDDIQRELWFSKPYNLDMDKDDNFIDYHLSPTIHSQWEYRKGIGGYYLCEIRVFGDDGDGVETFNPPIFWGKDISSRSTYEYIPKKRERT